MREPEPIARPTRLFRNGNSQAVRIPKALAFDSVDIEVEIPYDDSRLVALFHEHGRVEEESFGQSGTRLRGAVPSALAGRFDAFRVEPATSR